MNPIKIDSIDSYVKTIINLNSKLERNGANKNEILLFRGQENAEYELIPSLGRKRKFSTDITIFDEERNLVETMKYKLPDVFRKDLNPLELLALLQHHGIPTRLLDITENSLVALYFACSSLTETDGEVIIFKENELDVATYPVIYAIADSYKFVQSSFASLSIFYRDVFNQPYFLEQKKMLESIHNFENTNNPDRAGGKWIEECCEKPLFVFAPINTARQKAQQGRYILFPNAINHKNDDSYFEKIIKPISKDNPCVCNQIIIPKELKETFLNDLRLFGISQESLFPDDIDKICDDVLAQFKHKMHQR